MVDYYVLHVVMRALWPSCAAADFVLTCSNLKSEVLNDSQGKDSRRHRKRHCSDPRESHVWGKGMDTNSESASVCSISGQTSEKVPAEAKASEG